MNVRLPPGDIDYIDARRNALGLSRDEWVHRMIGHIRDTTQTHPEGTSNGSTESRNH